MKCKRMLFVFTSFILILEIGCAKKEDFPVLKGPYFGQKPPGKIPELFAPGIISIEESAEYGGHFSPDFNEFYFSRYSPGSDHLVWVAKNTNGLWSEPRIIEFMDEFPGNVSCISPDESFILFDSARPNGYGKTDIYICIKTIDGLWSEAKNVGSPVNSEYSDWYPNVTPDGKYLMFARNPGRNPDIMWVDAEIIEALQPGK